MVGGVSLAIVAGAALNVALGAEDWTAPLYGDTLNDTVTYEPLPAHSVSKKWSLCVGLPHMKDAYYVAKDYGMVQEAKRQGVKLTVLSAGGYANVQKQIEQLENCVASGGDAVLVNAVSPKGLVGMVEEFHAKGVPVIDMGNGLDSDLVAARAKAAYEVAGLTAGQYLAKLHPSGSETANLVWLAGPPGAHWSEDAVKGMKQGIEGSAVTLLKVMYGDTGKGVQMGLIENALQTYPDVNIIGGVGPAIEGAMELVRVKGRSDIKLLSFYTTPAVEQGVRDGKVMATVCDYNPMGSRISVDQALRILEKKPYIKIAKRRFFVVDGDNVNTYDRSVCLAPDDFKPVFELN